jgi:hypothetical protein
MTAPRQVETFSLNSTRLDAARLMVNSQVFRGARAL